MAEAKDDQELRAIQRIISALSDLDGEAEARVIGYVFPRLAISAPAALVESRATGTFPVSGTEGAASLVEPGRRQVDIRAFGQEKTPRSAKCLI